MREPLRGNFVALFVPPNSAPGDVLEVTVNIRFEHSTTDSTRGTRPAGGSGTITTNALERSFEQLAEGTPKKTVMGRIFGSTFMQPWTESDKKPAAGKSSSMTNPETTESDRAMRSSKGRASDFFHRLTRNSDNFNLKPSSSSNGNNDANARRASSLLRDGKGGPSKDQSAKEEPNSDEADASSKKTNLSPVGRDAPPEAIAAAAMRGAKASQGKGPSSGALLPYGGSKDDDVHDPAESYAAAKRAVRILVI